MPWTKEQQKAIDTEGKNIIVSAGAGSGKTAVLTERVKRKLLNGIHINELLVLTFTNAAAAEMKERIRKTIKKTPSLKEELNLLDGAYITTFDAFSLSLVKKYHTVLNITNNIKVSDEVVIDMKKREILKVIFEENYLSPKQDFIKLINDFCLKDDKELMEYILNVYQKIELKYDKKTYLENYILLENKKIDFYIEEYIKNIKVKKQTLFALIDNLKDYFEDDFIIKVEDNFKKLKLANTYDEIINSLDFKSLMVPKNSSQEGKKIKKNIFDIAKEIKELCRYSSIDEMKDELKKANENASIIIEIIRELDKRLEEYKLEKEVFNFTDIAHLAIKIVLENEDIREELKNSFQEILVDEYQDTSDTQEKFISLIANNNVYMVGDIKQSIYRFRNANPYIFKEKYDTYRDTEEGIKIDLLKNFRSREEVLDDINFLFEQFMDDNFGGADYKSSHKMVFGNKTYQEEGATNQNYKFDILTYNEADLGKITKDEEEAFIIGEDIKRKIQEKFQIFDKDELRLRDAEYKDFVILLDKSKNFNLYKKVFEYLHIPLSILKEESLKKEDDAIIIKNLLRLLICVKENRFDQEFRYTYTSISRSFLMKISDEEIYKCFVNNSFKDSELYQKCLKLTENMDIMSISGYFSYILEEFQYEEKLLTIGNIKSFCIREEYFYNLCKSYEEMGKTIYEFADYLNQIFEKNYELKFNVNTTSSNSCRIMTIHKSKGLEFPICYFASFSSRFNIRELKERIFFDDKYGLILPKVDGYYKDTILKTLVKQRVKLEEISEKIRLLYVALTRAKEKMIMVIPEQVEEEEHLGLVPDYEREKYNSFLSIMKSIYSTLLPVITKTNVMGTKEYLNLPKIESDNLTSKYKSINVEELSVFTEEIEESHFSKENIHLISKEEKKLMDFGTKVHQILEEIDFNDYDLSAYDVEDTVKQKIDSFLKSDFMRDRLSSKMYKEYEFLYQEDRQLSHGIIDLLMEEENNMVIIDYKLKNIIDENYDKQLNGYRKYIKEITKKEVKCYLYSILDEKFREVVCD